MPYFAEGREESIAVTSVGPDGGFYLATRQIRILIRQGRAALPQAVADGDLPAEEAAAIGQLLDNAAFSLDAADLPEAPRILQGICQRIG